MLIEMPSEEILINESLKSAFVGGAIGVIIALGIALLLLILIALYVYFALAWMSIGKKLKFKKSWLAWIPFANLSMILNLGKFHWAWVFLVLIPIIGWIALFVLIIIAHWRIFEKRGYPGWFSLSLVIPQVGFVLYYIAIGFVAWSNNSVRLGETIRKRNIKRTKKKRASR